MYRLMPLLLTLFVLACAGDKGSEDSELTSKYDQSQNAGNEQGSNSTQPSDLSTATLPEGVKLKEGQLRLDVHVANAPSQAVKLDFIDYENIDEVASIQLDAEGKGTFQDYLLKEGIYRIAQSETNYWLVSLRPGYYTLKVDAADLYAYDFSGDEWAEGFEDAIHYLVEVQEPVNQMYTDLQNLQASGANAATIDQAAAAANQASVEMQKDLADYASKTNNLMVKVYYAGLLLAEMQTVMPYYEEVMAEMNEEMPFSSYTAQLGNFINQVKAQDQFVQEQAANPGSPTIGTAAPEISQPNPEGVNIALSSLKGKVVLIDFWASWCGPCRVENPNVVAAYNKYKDKGFTIYSVSLDNNKQKWVDAIAADGLIWPNHVSDLKGWNAAPAAKYGVNSIPATFLIDENGVVIAKNLRGASLENKLAELLD